MYSIADDEPGDNVAGDFPDLFGDVEAENVAAFLFVPKAYSLVLSAELGIFQVVSQEVGYYLELVVSVDADILEDSGGIVDFFLVVDDDVDLDRGGGTVPGVHDLSTTSSTLSYFLALRRLLFFDFAIFYSLMVSFVQI